ncbi:MAG: exodeoxyribonuclease III [Hydrogenophaga sp.]|jgi:exodeoxyribonuclease-3|uniref:exodeoxyribonuclease III n=1 Tax=Hydrogenophaga sp. TaxID=1904254 RepID=UPI000EE4BAFA|nr:exodeoxyribonuclease III [Hydrogenophaga sp.]MDD3784802.1 exodeoxyribonuclease III [Hydrogenophaga sp.]MDX9968965.1 exodeoxyribonuclease III [Hydrogenophaga sp.]HAJ12627.1 exodeoxyribonuclease III [Comamonadaceae bacterium]
MQLATWNINSLSVRLPQVLDWLAANPVDVLALQELKLTDDRFPAQAFADAGYHAQWFGQKTYNGVALISRSPATEVIRNIPGFEDEQSRVLCATIDGIRVIGAYFPNGQAPGSDKFTYKMRWLDALRTWVRTEMASHPQLVLMGDFNITFDDLDVWDPEGLRETIHCTTEERNQLQALMALGLHDAHRLFEQPPRSFSWWDYRMLGFQKNRGLRIDHILISDALRARATACTIDRQPRKNKQPSDHAPVVLTLAD